MVAPSVAALVLISATSFSLWRRERDATESVDHTLRVRTRVLEMKGALVQAEASFRGYLLAGEEQWLEDQTGAMERVSAGLISLGGETRDNPRQAARLRDIEPLFSELLVVVDAQKGRGPGQASLELVQQAHGLRSRIAEVLDAMMREEERLLDERVARRERLWRLGLLTHGLALLLGLVGGLASTFLFTRGVEHRIAALGRSAVRLGNREPLGALPEGADEIGRLGDALAGAADLLAARETALEQRTAEVRDLYDQAPCGYHSLDADGLVVEINQTELAWLGYDRHEVVGRVRFPELLTPESRARFAENYPRFKREGRIDDLEFAFVRRDGSTMDILLSASAVFGSDGAYLTSRSTMVDITARKRAEGRVRSLNESLERRHQELLQVTAEAQRANQKKSEFLANMSHELRTPLNAVIGFAELMHDGKVGPVSAEHREYLGDILTSARHLLQLINDVLDLSKIEAGRMEFRPEAVDPARAVREVQAMLRTLAAERRVDLRDDLGASPTEIVTDPGRLKQVLYNYISNALKFTPERGQVTVRLSVEDADHVRLEVEDTGIGISEDDQKRLFQEFLQLEGGPGPRPIGTGLGLALTRRIVEAQGGRVGVRSTPGQGSVFFAVLPRSVPATSALPKPGGREKSGPSGRRLLVVDDDERDREWLLKTLTGAGYAAEAVSTGEEALARCSAHRYDAVLLDLLLSDRSGWDVVRAMRNSESNRHTPVIVVSVVADRGASAAFRVDAYLTKPVKPEEIVSALRAAGALPTASAPILVVDDDPRDLRLVEITLQGSGYRTIGRASGREALLAAEAEPPAAIVLDLSMPEMDGFEFLAHYRAAPHGRNTPVVVWTGLDLTPDLRDRLRESAQRVVSKQEGAAFLLAEVAHALGSRPETGGAAR